MATALTAARFEETVGEKTSKLSDLLVSFEFYLSKLVGRIGEKSNRKFGESDVFNDLKYIIAL